mgnify:CR=1 FL=1
MKLTNKQLRKIISETVRTRISESPYREAGEQERYEQEAPKADVPSNSEEVAEFVVEALVRWFDEEGSDIIGGNAFEMMTGTLVNTPEFTDWASDADPDAAAREAADLVMSSPELKQQVIEICKNMLLSAKDI